jgi:hypothetical protein
VTLSSVVLFSSATHLSTDAGVIVRSAHRFFLSDASCGESEWSGLVPAACAAVGAWLSGGATMLDWDTAWQHWPWSGTLGVVGGYCFGIVALILARWRCPSVVAFPDSWKSKHD